MSRPEGASTQETGEQAPRTAWRPFVESPTRSTASPATARVPIQVLAY